MLQLLNWSLEAEILYQNSNHSDPLKACYIAAALHKSRSSQRLQDPQDLNSLPSPPLSLWLPLPSSTLPKLTFLQLCWLLCCSLKLPSLSKPLFSITITVLLSRFSSVWLWATLCTVDRQAPLSKGFSRQGYWSGLLCPPPGDFPHHYREIFPNPTLPTNFWWLKVDVFHTIIIWFRKPTLSGHIRSHWSQKTLAILGDFSTGQP